jgi:hypothetical protein
MIRTLAKRFLLSAISICASVAILPADVIDFTEASYSLFEGQSAATFTAAGYELTLRAELGTGIPDWALPFLTPTLSHEAGSGMGVHTTVFQSLTAFDPEIEYFERLTITASPYLNLFGFTLHNLYREGWLIPYNEKAQYRINGGEWETVTGNSSGSVYVALGGPMTGVQTLDFRAGPGGLFQHNDFALGSLDVAPVPEPGSFALLGGSLLLAGVLYRRRKGDVRS